MTKLIRLCLAKNLENPLAYKIVYKESAARDLKKLSKAEASRILDQTESDLSTKADTNPVLKGQFKGLRKYRASDHRVIFAILGEDVLVLRIGHRKDIDKKSSK